MAQHLQDSKSRLQWSWKFITTFGFGLILLILTVDNGTEWGYTDICSLHYILMNNCYHNYGNKIVGGADSETKSIWWHNRVLHSITGDRIPMLCCHWRTVEFLGRCCDNCKAVSSPGLRGTDKPHRFFSCTFYGLNTLNEPLLTLRPLPEAQESTLTLEADLEWICGVDSTVTLAKNAVANLKWQLSEGKMKGNVMCWHWARVYADCDMLLDRL